MLWLGARQQVSGKLFFGELGSTVHLVWFCSFLTCLTIILWSQEAGGNPDLWGLVSRGDQHLNQYEFIDCYHVLRWSITWRRQKSSQQMTLLRELKLGQPGLPSDRWEIIWALLVMAIQNNGDNKVQEDPIPLQQNLIVSCRTLFWGRDWYASLMGWSPQSRSMVRQIHT